MVSRYEADELNSIAVELQAQGRSQESLRAFEQAGKVYRAIGDRKGEGRCLNGAGAIWKDLGEPQKARESLELALPLRRETSDRLGEAITLTTLGPVYQRLGDPVRARECLVEALRITRLLGHRQREGEALYNLGEVATRAGMPGSAYASFQQALAIARQENNPVEGHKCVIALAIVANDLGRKREALDYCLESLRIAEMLQHLPMQSCALHNLGMILAGTVQQDLSRGYFERAVAIDLKINAHGSAARTMICLVGAYIRHDLVRARQHAERAIAIAEKLGDESLRASALGSLAQVLIEEGVSPAIFDVLDESLRLARQIGERHQEGGVLYLMALALDKAGEFQAAFAKFEEAIAIFEEHYCDLATEDYRISYFNAFSIQNAYLTYSSRLVKHGKKVSDTSFGEHAFHVCERRHTRCLREFLGSRLGHERANDYGAGGGSTRASAQEHTGAGLGRIDAPKASEVRTRLLDADTVLLEYSLHAEVSYLWVLTPEEVVTIELSLGGNEIRERVGRLRDALVAGSMSFVSLAHELHEILIRPAERWLNGKKTLLVVPDNALHVLPFQLLVTRPARSVGNGDAEYLVSKHAITYAPSAAIFGVLGNIRSSPRTKPRDLIAFAPVEFKGEKKDHRWLGPLPGTDREVRDIAALFDSSRYVLKTFDAATKQAMLSERLSDYRFVHFATHGLADDENSDVPAIVLRGAREGEDEDVLTTEIANLKMDVDLVVLSACETALGTVTAGEGILGLTRAFFCAGARSVCASMWKVDDDATSFLMKGFYKNLVHEGLTTAQALQASQLEVIRTGKWSSPFFWASFVLSGAWR